MLSLYRLTFLRWLLVIIVLAGCTGAGEPTSTPPPTVAVTATAPPTEAPPTPLPSKPTTEMPASPTAPLASPTSTVTPAPTSTPTPPPSPTKTLVAPTTTVVPDIDIIVDNQHPAFSTTGWWFIGDGGQSYDGDCVWAPRGIQNIAYVRLELTVAGAYEVFAWWCGNPNHDQSRRERLQHQRLLSTRAADHEALFPPAVSSGSLSDKKGSMTS